MKKWLSRALVLAMIVAMMVPMPVAAAKSSGGGKLVASVTYYDVDATGQGWDIQSKTSYKYGNGNMPTEITRTWYTDKFLGVPVGGSSSTQKIKYSKKSEKRYDSAGFLSGKAALKGGKVVSYSEDNKTSRKRTKADGTVYDFAEFSAEVGHASYFKNGLAKATDGTWSYQDSDNISYAYTNNSVFAWTQKNGVPSMMYRTTVWNGKGYDFEEEEYYNFDGTPSTDYAVFNSKGLVIEAGSVENGKNVPDTAITYTMKKGKVDTAVIYSVNEKGVPQPQAMLKFKYTKKSVSKAFNLRMMNDLIEYGNEFNGFDCPGFIWY